MPVWQEILVSWQGWERAVAAADERQESRKESV